MRKNTEIFCSLLKTNRCKPAKSILRENGCVSMCFYVDNDDDRFVEVSDSVHSDDLVILCRDRSNASVVVVSSLAMAATVLSDFLGALSPGRPVHLNLSPSMEEGTRKAR